MKPFDVGLNVAVRWGYLVCLGVSGMALQENMCTHVTMQLGAVRALSVSCFIVHLQFKRNYHKLQ